jgi:nucleoside-diphosphate-sugar epimerase
MAEKTKILVTGASGFVGSSVVKELQNIEQYNVYGLVSNRKGIEINIQTGLKKVFQSDISDSQTLRETEELKKTNILVHTAGLAHQFGRVKKEDFWRVNVRGTENICRLAEKLGVEHFVLISSVAVYGVYGNSKIDETYICQPSGIYAESKLESENRAIEFCEQKNIRLTILRPATVIGEGDLGNTTRLITLIDRGRFLWVGKGENKKSLIYKKDVAKGILKVIESKESAKAEIYNLTNESVSMKEIVQTISERLDRKMPRLAIPEKFFRGFFRLNKTKLSLEYLKKFEKTFEKWLSDDIFSGERFYEKFNFKPETTVYEALSKQVDYYLSHKRSD